MKNAKRDLPKALSIATIGVMAIYVLFIISLYRVVAYTDLLSATYGWFIFNAAYILFGNAGQMIIMISVAISVFGALNGSILVFPRVYQKMAEDGLFFKSVAKNHPKYQTPHISLILSAVFASVLVASEFLIPSISVESLLTFVVFAGLIFNTLIFISLFKFRKTHPVDQYPRYQVWGYPVVPGLAILGLVMLLVATLVESLVPSLIGLGVLILGYMIFTWIELRKKKTA